MFIIIVFDLVLTRSSPFPSLNFYCSPPRDQSRDVTPRSGVFVIFQCTSFRVASSFRLYYEYVATGVLKPLRLK